MILYIPDSDIDVALSYEGTISEDTFFNYLKEDMLFVEKTCQSYIEEKCK